QEVTRSGGRGVESDADRLRELGMTRRHECSHRLMAGLDELELLARAVERPQKTVDAVTGIAEDPPHAPLGQAVEDEVGDSRVHRGVIADLRASKPCSRGSTGASTSATKSTA